jgi:hypothetical protein
MRSTRTHNNRHAVRKIQPNVRHTAMAPSFVGALTYADYYSRYQAEHENNPSIS